MSRVAALVLCWHLAACCVWGCATAPPGDASRPAEPQTEPAGPLDAAEAADLAQALAEAGVLLGAQERQVLGLAGEERDGPGRDHRAGSRMEVTFRQRGSSTAPSSTRVAAAVATGPLEAAARGGQDADGAFHAAAVTLDLAGIGAGAGRGAWEHGFGLLSAAPGRRRGLDAGTPLRWPRQGWAPEPGAATETALQGVTGRLGAGGVAAMAGLLRPARADGRSSAARLAGVSVTSRAGEAAVLAVTAPTGSGASLWLVTERGPSLAALETVAWRSRGEGPAGGAWAALLRRAAGPWRVEFMAAGSGGGAGPGLGRPPAVLAAWDGAGWCARGVGRTPAAGRLSVLVARAQTRAPGSAGPRTTTRTRWELEWAGCPVRGWRAECSLGSQLSVESGWRGRSPWLAPAPLSRAARLQATARAWRESGPWRLGVALRLLAARSEIDTAGATPGAARWLAQLSCDRVLAPGWSARAAVAQAWGESADLRSVATPAPGVIVGRAWGGWSAERSLGLAGSCLGVRIVAALALRRPAVAGAREAAEWWLAATAGRR